MTLKQMLELYEDRPCHVNIRDNGRVELTYYLNPNGTHREIGQVHHTGMITEVYDDFFVFERRSRHATAGDNAYALHHIFPSQLVSITRIVEEPSDSGEPLDSQ